MARPGKVPPPYLVGEFTYPILPPHQGGAQWFYSLPKHDALCLSADYIYKEYRGALKHGNIFSLDLGPDYAGKLRQIDVETLRKVGDMIKNPPTAPQPPLSSGKPAKASSTWQAPGYEAAKAFDDDDDTRWGAAEAERSGWLEVDLGTGSRISRVVVKELGYPRTEEFAIEYEDGGTWKELARGTTLAGEKEFKFPPVSARHVRLHILKATQTPTIEEFQVYQDGK